MRCPKIFNHQRGDTIVEVLIVLTVLSMALSISYATANRGLAQARRAEEHTQALGLMSGQVEMLRTAVEAKVSAVVNATSAFCIANTNFNDPAHAVISISDVNDTAHYPAACIKNTYYRQYITRNASGNYVINTIWDGTGNSGLQKEQFTYRVPKLNNTVNTDTTFSSAPAQIFVTVKKIAPLGDYDSSTDRTPPCTNTPSINYPGLNVNLSNGTSAPTDSASSTATFPTGGGDLDSFDSYTASVSAPGGYQVCKGNTASSSNSETIQANPGPNTITSLSIRPVCNTPQDYTTTETGSIHHHDRVDDYGWQYSSTRQRTPQGVWISTLSPSQVQASGPYGGYTSGNGTSGWGVADNQNYVAGSSKDYAWYYYRGPFGSYYAYEDMWDHYIWTVVSYHYNDWDEPTSTTTHHTRYLCPA